MPEPTLSIAIVIAILMLSSAPVAAETSGEDVRLPAGFVLIRPDAGPVSARSIPALADDAFEGMDGDGNRAIDVGELTVWRDSVRVQADEDVLAALLDLDAETMMEAADRDGDGTLVSAEVRALALYDVAVHDADGDGVLAPEELDVWRPALLHWASRTCPGPGMPQGMLLGAFCAR